LKFAIITHAEHKLNIEGIYSYAPFVREMRLWEKYTSELMIVSPVSNDEIHLNELDYKHNIIIHKEIKSFDITTFMNVLKSFFLAPKILIQIYISMKWADHIHLRCPGNVGLLGCFVQILFPSKLKTVKYAGNWDPNSKQPISYRFQKWILSNTILTKNCKVLVYGNWSGQSKNILPFFTASYSENEIVKIPEKRLNKDINLIFVGNFSKGKQPLKSVQVSERLFNNGYNVKLNMYGEGIEFKNIEEYIGENKLQDIVQLHGNQSKEIVKKAFQNSHFLVFISKSEGWPKVVAEAMFWSCLPVSTKVSCVPYMLDHGKRGALINDNVDNIVKEIEYYLKDENVYLESIQKAKLWSQHYTLEKFDNAIKGTL